MANSYRCSDGSRVLKSVVDKRVHEAKGKKIEQMVDEFGYVFCEDCQKNASAGEPIDCSHDKSVDRCQKDGETEKAWDVQNITMRCRQCHRKHDKM